MKIIRIFHSYGSRPCFHGIMVLTTAPLNPDVKRNFACKNTYKSRGILISLCKRGRLTDALKTLHSLGIHVDSFTYASLLHGCVKENAIAEGKLIHAHIIQTGLERPDLFLGNTLLNMYAKWGYVKDARQVFDKMPERNVVSWTMMIAGYAQNGYNDKALDVFYEMKGNGIEPNAFSFASVLPACADKAALEQGREIHDEIVRRGFQYNVFVGNALVDMYAKCGCLEIACQVFDKMPQRNSVSCNVMMGAYMQNGLVENALELFQNIHERNVVSYNAMIAGCVQNGLVEEAWKIFREMPNRDVVSWTAMIAGYAQNGHAVEALKLSRQMQLAGMKPNSKTFAVILSACANLAVTEKGREVHEMIIRDGLESDVFVGSALIDMYAKCGSLENGRSVFNKMPYQDVVSWSAMVLGYSMHGFGKEALHLFEQMQQCGINPDHVTFIGVLSACCHEGLVNEGWKYFESMKNHYCVTPKMDHYACMVNLLGHAGRLDEAHDFVNKMPMKPDATLWVCLLGYCRIHTNIKLAEHIAECLYELDPKTDASYVLLSNIYAAAGMWDEIQKVRKLMKERQVQKKPGCSWIEVNKEVHVFLSGDITYMDSKDLCRIGEIIWPDKGHRVCI